MSRLGYRLAEVLNAIPQGGGEYAARCPICGDSTKDKTKKRFHINVEHDKFICFNGGCPARGNRKELIELLQKLDGGIKPEFLIGTGEGPSSIVISPLIKQKPPLSPEAIQILKRAVPYHRFPPLIKKLFLKDILRRKVFTFKEIQQLYAVPQCIRKNWDWRVIIPVTAEIFQGKSVRGEKPKYLSPPGLDWFIDDDIPNGVECSNNDTVIIAEGILDYHSLPRFNRSLTGGDKKFYSSQMMGYTKNYRKVIYALDSDFAGYCVITELYPFRNQLPNVRIFYPHMVDEKQKDLNDLLIHNVQTKDELRSLILSNTISISEAYLHVIGKKLELNYVKGESKWKLRELKTV